MYVDYWYFVVKIKSFLAIAISDQFPSWIVDLKKHKTIKNCRWDEISDRHSGEGSRRGQKAAQIVLVKNWRTLTVSEWLEGIEYKN